MIILGIETSCDETSAAVLKQDKGGRIQILSNVVSSSLLMHAKYGGVIPEQAAREQLKLIIPVIETSINDSGLTIKDIDAIAVTYGPGLIGSLLVGVETAKTLATVWNKPLIPVNHLIGHFYANWIDQSSVLGAQLSVSGQSDISSSVSETDTQKTGRLESENRKPKTDNRPPSFPCIGLLVSGGHTDLVLFKDHNKYEYLGGTRDDAAGECFDKCARVLGFTYPGGPKISKLAEQGQDTIHFPRPMIDSKDFDFSFSGLKTAFVNLVNQKFNLDKGSFDKETQTWTQKSLEEQLTPAQLKEVKNICASLEQAIVDTLVTKTIAAAQKYNVEQIIVAGGVAANRRLVNSLQVTADSLKIKLNVPAPEFCTDNGAMIAAAAFFIDPITDPLSIQANPNLSLQLPLA